MIFTGSTTLISLTAIYFAVLVFLAFFFAIELNLINIYLLDLPITLLSLGFFLLAEAEAFLEADANIAPAAFLE
jgi:hypothetical protein